MAKTPDELRARLVELLERFDFNYQYCDYYPHWKQENDKSIEIAHLMRQVPDGEALYLEAREKRS